MPKTAPREKSTRFNYKAFWKIAAPALVLLVVVLTVIVYALYRPIVDNPTTVRTALVESLKELNHPAAVDAKTGDVYFPEAKLYLPRGDKVLDEYFYTYYDRRTGVGEGHELSIVSKSVMQRAISSLYGARDSVGVFNKMPHAQACARGILLTDAPLAQLDGRKLDHRQTSVDGRVWYVYTSPKCSELVDIAPEIRQLQSY